MRPTSILVIAYLLGSIPFGYLLVRATQGADVRETGSGGTGATNVSRRAGKAAGVVTLLLDGLKGVAAIASAKALLGLAGFGIEQGAWNAGRPLPNAPWWLAAAAVAVIAGHIFPVWLRFRGGKGVATGVGVFLVLAPIAVACATLIFLVAVAATRYVSLGSILGAVAIPVFVVVQHLWIRPFAYPEPLLAAAAGGAALIVFAHRGNVARLLNGSESRFK